MKHTACLLLALCIAVNAFSQEDSLLLPVAPLSPMEEAALRDLPVLELPDHHKGKFLPPVVDNSTQIYMRDVFQQHMYCCGQAAGIAYNYTYEIDRLRDLPANTGNNLYPTHFTWNWMNSGYGWYGVSYLHSFQVLKHCGTVNVADYGGSLSYGGETRWMSGYTEYYRGMENRINQAYQIYVGDPEGLEVFKHWLNDHHETGAVGGVGSFYSQYMAVSNTLPPGTPEEGKYVLTYFGGSANHAQTIVGYNDSIRWDYNNDGQYTNDVDINNDGVVNMKDWEIGGFKMVQSYGGVPNWGDQGYAYMMYKTVADDLGEGGIWNHCVHVLDVKEDCDPQATMKVSITHDKREMIKVVAGLSNDVNAMHPQYILEFPIFNYQGGMQYMQGGNSDPANKTLEFGLDISPLLSNVPLGQDVRLFLQVYEYDPGNSGTGQVNSFSVYDYTGVTTEIICPQTNVVLDNNALTSLSLTASFDFDRVHIVNDALPPVIVGQPYTAQLIADGGSPPYRFNLVKEYAESTGSQAFPMINQDQLYPTNNTKGFATQALDFDFPYYDSVYSSVSMHVDGYLMFDEQLFPYPYFIDDMVMFRITRHISPFMCHAMRLYPSDGDGMWYEGDDTQATFRWKASIDGAASGTDINVAVSLFPDGKIEFYYGDITIGDDILWVPGLCDGNEDDMQFSSFYFDSLPDPDSRYEYLRYDYPEGLSVSEDGLITGTVQQAVTGESMTFKVTDNNFVHDTRTIAFSDSSMLIDDSISSGGDELVEYSELALLSLEVTNLESSDITNASISISCGDNHITLIDDFEDIGTLPAGVSVELINAFSFQVSPDIPDMHSIVLDLLIDGDLYSYNCELIYTAYAPLISLEDILIDDGDNERLDPGDTAGMMVEIENQGGSEASLMNCQLSCDDPYVSINDGQHYVSILRPDSSALLEYEVSVDEATPVGHQVTFMVIMTGSMGFTDTVAFQERIGLTLEDFETGDFSLFSWGFSGDRNWVTEDQNPFEGDFSAASAHVLHNESSSMLLDLEITEAGNINFYRKVSCEDAPGDDADYLAFCIDGEEQARWDSITEWEEVSFPVSAGYHRFEWRYVKDAALSEGLDAAFVDYITIPACNDMCPQLDVVPEQFDRSMKPFMLATDTLLISNTGMGDIHIDILVSNTGDRQNGNRNISGAYLQCEQETFRPGETFLWDLRLYNASMDDEWLKDLSIQIPQDIEVQSANNFSGGSGGPMNFSGNFGNGPLMSWHGEDASGNGVVHGGEYAFAKIGGTVLQGFTGNATLSYTITGDSQGGEPHVVNGSLELLNQGTPVSWLSCELSEMSIPGQGQQELLLTFNTDSLEDGHYYCELRLHDNFQHQTVIPVHLLVDTYLGEQSSEISTLKANVYPNPFTDEVHIRLTLEREEAISIHILDNSGREVITLLDEHSLSAGKHSFLWNADQPGMNNGMYFVIINNGQGRILKKIIRNK